VAWADEAAVPQLTAALVFPNTPVPGATELRLYNDAYLQVTSRFSMLPFVVGSTNYPGYGQFVFWDKSESNLIVVEKADASANLPSSYAVTIRAPFRKIRSELTSQ
jgi:hypothetical protein